MYNNFFSFRFSEEVDWLIQGASRFFPDKWKEFIAPIPEEERDDILTAYYKR